MQIQIGQPAPLFSLYSSEKEKVELQSFIGGKNILILFFPQAFTGVCTQELCSVRDELSKYEQVNAEVLAISVDSPFTLAVFKEQQQYNFKILSDFNKEVSQQYGSIYDSFTNMDMKGVSKRSAFIIDKKGIIQYAQVLESAGDIPDFVKINEVLASIA